MKTKRAGREMNPTDAFRKQARKRENKRNKAERTYIREAFGKAQDTSKLTELKTELEELIRVEQTSELNRLQKLRKKVVQEAYEVAIRKKKEEELKQRQAEEDGTQQHAGLSSVPLPKPPPLPAGPLPGLPPPPGLPPLPAGPAGPAGPPPQPGVALLPPPPGPPPSLEAIAAAAAASGVPVLPPPPGPPPPSAMLPPPPGPPPMGMLPPPAGPPPGMLPPPSMPPPMGAGMLPPPAMPPPGSSSILPPPTRPPPGYSSSSKPPGAAASAGAAPIISGASTVARRPLAHQDKALTSMVPASVLVRREAAASGKGSGPQQQQEELRIGPGFGLAPVQRPNPGGRTAQQQQPRQPMAPPPQLGRWGNAVTIVNVPAGSNAAPAAAAAAAKAGAPSKPAADDKMSDFMNSLKDLGAFD